MQGLLRGRSAATWSRACSRRRWRSNRRQDAPRTNASDLSQCCKSPTHVPDTSATMGHHKKLLRRPEQSLSPTCCKWPRTYRQRARMQDERPNTSHAERGVLCHGCVARPKYVMNHSSDPRAVQRVPGGTVEDFAAREFSGLVRGDPFNLLYDRVDRRNLAVSLLYFTTMVSDFQCPRRGPPGPWRSGS